MTVAPVDVVKPIRPDDTFRVVKVGGSLLRSSAGMSRAIRWVEHDVHATTIVVTGGGDHADAIRELDANCDVDPQVSHQLAVRSMTLLSFVISQIGDWPFINEWDQLLAWRQRPGRFARICVFDVASYLRTVERELLGNRLPVGWSVTSDSIAARIAETVGMKVASSEQQPSTSPELVLLKSCRPPGMSTIADAVREGYVDAHFDVAAENLPVTKCVDLSNADRVAEVLPVILRK